MSSDVGSVELAAVTKVYDLGAKGMGLRDAVPGRRPVPRDGLVAVDGVDLAVAPGEALGIIGPNGAGKSTLLKLIAGVTQPTSGSVAVRGRLGSMIELGLGFHPELTGWENLRSSGVMLGLTRDELDEVAPAMAAFSGIEPALGEPLRTYSTGMRARLGFAVATHVGADVLAVDEVLSVGDSEFQMRCIERVAELGRAGTTLIFVSHDMAVVRAVCSRVVHVRSGRIVDDGAVDEVIEAYIAPSPSRFRVAADRSFHFIDCHLTRPTINSWEPFEIDAVVEVHRPVPGALVAVELARPVAEPEPPMGIATQTLTDFAGPGRYRLRGTSSSFPAQGGSLRIITSLVDTSAYELADRADLSLTVPGALRSGNMSMDVTPTFTIEPVDEPSVVASRPVAWSTAGSSAGSGGVGSSGVASGGGASAGPSGAGDRDTVISVVGVTKRYEQRRASSAPRRAFPGRLGAVRADGVAALDGVSLSVSRGTSIGVVGPNGAGKSTLLRLLAGVTTPDHGSVSVEGQVVPMLDLGMGFHPDLSGWANLHTSARLLDMTRDELLERAEAIASFADIGDMLDQPVKRYSMGMRARLGFALAIHVPADILLIDELLAVGDEDFRRKALEAVLRRCREGAVVVFVSHGLRLVEEVCDRAIRIDRGRIVDDGPAAEVIERYGGPSWAAGTADTSEGIRLHRLTVGRHQVAVGGTVTFEGHVEVDVPSPYCRLELTYRVPPDDRSVVVDALELQDRTFFHSTLVPAGGCLSEAGWYHFAGEVEHTLVAGSYDLVLAVIDEVKQETVNESWQSLLVGGEREENRPQFVFQMSWEVEKMDAESTS